MTNAKENILGTPVGVWVFLITLIAMVLGSFGAGTWYFATKIANDIADEKTHNEFQETTKKDFERFGLRIDRLEAKVSQLVFIYCITPATAKTADPRCTADGIPVGMTK